MAANTLNDLLEAAIEQEISSQKFYQGALEYTDEPRVKTFLRRLIAEEKNHEKILRGVTEMEMYDGTIPVGHEVLSGAQSSHDAGTGELSREHTLADLFEIALKRETTAYNNFMKMAETAGDKELNRLFTSLAEEEQTHYKHIEQEYRITTGEMGYEG